MIILAESAAILYLLYFLRDRIHYSVLFPGQKAEDGLALLLVVYSVVAIATAVVAGVVSDRLGRRRGPVAVSAMVMVVPAVMLAVWPTWHVTIAAAVVLGLGFGIYLSVDQALVTQVLPTAEGRAKDLGVISVASAGAQALAPAVAAPLVAYGGGYPTLFFGVAGILVLGALAVGRIKSVP
ncbi:hypothetical protein GCM10009839_62260 [Catenulispora yoronensis]|uniref:Major facilitator superfamily (MFS) profile domain-containing protein n=1 Tax=Catenulispora yoronensis TaxID=450799 RepID=A0ABN2V274_9ACTN